MVNLTPEERKLKLVIQRLLGEHLREIRLQKRFRQKEVADLCGFSRSGYNLIEKGQRNVTLFSLYKISKVLDEPLENLVKISGIKDL